MSCRVLSFRQMFSFHFIYEHNSLNEHKYKNLALSRHHLILAYMGNLVLKSFIPHKRYYVMMYHPKHEILSFILTDSWYRDKRSRWWRVTIRMEKGTCKSLTAYNGIGHLVGFLSYSSFTSPRNL